MKYFRRRKTLQEVASEIIRGLEDGSIVPDPPMMLDEDTSLPRIQAFHVTPVQTRNSTTFAEFTFTNIDEKHELVNNKEYHEAVRDSGDLVGTRTTRSKEFRYSHV